jgi:Fic family protein
MADDIRHSRAKEAQIITDPDQLAKQEALNGLLQVDAVIALVESILEGTKAFRLRPSHLLHLHRVALAGISPYAGLWRPDDISIHGSGHQPVGAPEVPEKIEELCDYVNENWQAKTAMHLASYIMWRLNWIHPFTDGNGRTSRATSYLVLCVRMGYLLPGKQTIPDQIAEDKTPYYKALEAADEAAKLGHIDLSEMENLLSAMLAQQLWAIHGDATGQGVRR